MYAASLNINASMVLPGLTTALDAVLLFLSLSQDKDAAFRAQGPEIVCLQDSSRLSKLTLMLAGPGN